VSELQDHELPAVDDQFVQMMGFQSVDQFKEQIRENIKAEKKQKEQEKRQTAIMDRIIEETDIKLPDVIINSELDKMINQLKHDIQQAGYEYENYLSQVGKTEDQIRQEWRPQAERKAKTQLILNKIAAQEGVTADDDQVNQQVDQLMEQHPSADREQAKVFVETQLMNQQVIQMLESQADSSTQTEATDETEEKKEQESGKKETKNATKKSSTKKSASKKSNTKKKKGE